MSTSDNGKAQLQQLVAEAHAATGRADADLTTAVAALIAAASGGMTGGTVVFSGDFSG